MEPDFWMQAWHEGRIGFHRGEYHPALLEYFPLLEAQTEQSILVPLCGKSHDLTWLSHQGLYVRGVEICKQAVEEYFKDNDITTFQKSDNTYTHQNLTLEVGDFLKHENPNNYDFIYDRAAIVALPPEMRIKYAKKWLELLKSGGKAILIAFEYDQAKVQGPPFSVPTKEIEALFSSDTDIELLEEKAEKMKNPKFKDAGVERVTWKVYLITKK